MEILQLKKNHQIFPFILSGLLLGYPSFYENNETLLIIQYIVKYEVSTLS
jgi:hypothetical protein